MKLKVRLLFIILSLSLLSCNLDDIKLLGITAVDIPDQINLGTALHFTMTCWTPTPCYKFHHTEINDSGFDIYVKVYARRLKGGCIQVIGTLIRKDFYIPKSRGEYTFHFYQESPSEYLIKVVNVQ